MLLPRVRSRRRTARFQNRVAPETPYRALRHWEAQGDSIAGDWGEGESAKDVKVASRATGDRSATLLGRSPRGLPVPS